jgi:hypothetical protein
VRSGRCRARSVHETLLEDNDGSSGGERRSLLDQAPSRAANAAWRPEATRNRLLPIPIVSRLSAKALACDRARASR